MSEYGHVVPSADAPPCDGDNCPNKATDLDYENGTLTPRCGDHRVDIMSEGARVPPLPRSTIEKALTLTQPWATLVMLGEKVVETRHVEFKHRGKLNMHASKEVDLDAWTHQAFRSTLARHGITSLEQIAVGAVLGSIEVIGSCKFTDNVFPHCLPASWHSYLAVNEKYFGDYRPGRGGLLMQRPKPFATPIPARGMNGFWNWDPQER